MPGSGNWHNNWLTWSAWAWWQIFLVAVSSPIGLLLAPFMWRAFMWWYRQMRDATVSEVRSAVRTWRNRRPYRGPTGLRRGFHFAMDYVLPLYNYSLREPGIAMARDIFQWLLGANWATTVVFAAFLFDCLTVNPESGMTYIWWFSAMRTFHRLVFLSFNRTYSWWRRRNGIFPRTPWDHDPVEFGAQLVRRVVLPYGIAWSITLSNLGAYCCYRLIMWYLLTWWYPEQAYDMAERYSFVVLLGQTWLVGAVATAVQHYVGRTRYHPSLLFYNTYRAGRRGISRGVRAVGRGIANLGPVRSLRNLVMFCWRMFGYTPLYFVLLMIANFCDSMFNRARNQYRRGQRALTLPTPFAGVLNDPYAADDRHRARLRGRRVHPHKHHRQITRRR